MVRCCVLSCNSDSGRKDTSVSIHSLPKNENKAQKWLDIIGYENLNKFTKSIYICSLHFEDSCMNRTLNVPTLREDALPSRNLLPPPARSSKNSIVVEKNQIQESSIINCNSPDMTEANVSIFHNEHYLIPKIVMTDQAPKTSNACSGLPAKPRVSICQNQLKLIPEIAIKPVPGSANTCSDLLVRAQKTIGKLRDTCGRQKKKIKALNERVRRLKKELLFCRSSLLRKEISEQT